MHHPTAIIHPDAKIGQNVSIGAFAIIDAETTIGDDSTVDPHVWITGKTIIGANNFIGFGSQIGGLPQDHAFDPKTSSGTIIGHHNKIRENVTIHRSTVPNGYTTIGDHNFLMVGSHLGHDVSMGNHNVIANNCLLAGHITIGNKTFLGGGAGFHQFINIGDYAIAQGNAAISKDIPPFCMVHGQNKLSGLNSIGLRRANFSHTERSELKKVFQQIFRSKQNLSEALKVACQIATTEASKQLIQACLEPSKKGVLSR